MTTTAATDLSGNSPATTNSHVDPTGRSVFVTNLQHPVDDSVAGTQVAASTSSTLLNAATPSRNTLTIVNDSSATLYVKYGTGASSTSYTHKLFQDDTLIIDDYNGAVYGAWQVATGYAYVTETTR